MHIVLNNVFLVGAGATFDPTSLQSAEAATEQAKTSINANLRFVQDGIVECVVTSEITANSNAMRIKNTYLGVFSYDMEGVSVEDKQRELSAKCASMMFPYIREFVADISRRLPVKAPVFLSPALGDERFLLEKMSYTEGTNLDQVTTPQQ